MSDAPTRLYPGSAGPAMQWSSDWASAPKNETKILVLLPDGNVTTAAFYWYTEGDHEAFRPVAYWSLHDLVRDEPLDDCCPVEDTSMKWAPMEGFVASAQRMPRDAVVLPSPQRGGE